MGTYIDYTFVDQIIETAKINVESNKPPATEDGEYSEGNVKECARDICFLVDNINKTNFKACIKKYSKI